LHNKNRGYNDGENERKKKGEEKQKWRNDRWSDRRT
jgi:hypothetical protein